MSKYDVSDFDADELNHAIDDTNFPHSHHMPSSSSTTVNGGKKGDENGSDYRRHTATSMPLPVNKNGHFSKSFSDDVFDVPGTPKTPRSLTTPGNCECLPVLLYSFVICTRTQDSSHHNINNTAQ